MKYTYLHIFHTVIFRSDKFCLIAFALGTGKHTERILLVTSDHPLKDKS